MGVLPAFRQRGIGKALLKTCEDALPNPVVQLTVRKSNQTAIQMYLNNGYYQVDLWEDYYSGGEAGIVMQKVKD